MGKITIVENMTSPFTEAGSVGGELDGGVELNPKSPTAKKALTCVTQLSSL